MAYNPIASHLGAVTVLVFTSLSLASCSKPVCSDESLDAPEGLSKITAGVLPSAGDDHSIHIMLFSYKCHGFFQRGVVAEDTKKHIKAIISRNRTLRYNEVLPLELYIYKGKAKGEEFFLVSAFEVQDKSQVEPSP